jgi:hypothetical protein
LTHSTNLFHFGAVRREEGKANRSNAAIFTIGKHDNTANLHLLNCLSCLASEASYQ